MPYLLNTSTSFQTISNDQSVQTIFKDASPAVQSDTASTFVIRTQANVPYILQLPSITRIQALAAKSTAAFDLSLKDVAGESVYTGCPSTAFLFKNELGFLYDHLEVVCSVAADVEISVCGIL